MQIIHTIQALRNALKPYTKVAFVPTMGNLHEGHIHLVEIAKQHADCVVVSIFVNPLQFGANEDLSNYPRTPEADCDKLRAAGATIVFMPDVKEMYPDFDGKALNQHITVTAPPIANELCGAVRPGHFDGVTTVVAKLFNMVQPDVAVFGKKDFQQLFIIREMVRQLNLPIDIIAGDTVREPSGLAKSSRNGYLTTEEKTQAAQLQKTLQQLVAKIQAGDTDYASLSQKACQILAAQNWVVDYVSVRASATLQTPTLQDRELVVLAAARLGKTRLIDNIDFLR